MSDELEHHKSSLRSRMRARLAGMDDRTRREAAAAACGQLVSLEVFRHASIVMLYMPMPGEVDLTPVAIRCFRDGKTVCVPRVDWRRGDMEPVEVSSFDDEVMDLDERGIRTPRRGSLVVPSMVDLVVVPGLAFDAGGNRLGRGGGFYDRFLGRLRRGAATIGLAFDLQVVDAVPADDRDLKVDILVTDRRVSPAGTSRTGR